MSDPSRAPEETAPTADELQGFLSWLATSGWIREPDDERTLRWFASHLPALLDAGRVQSTDGAALTLVQKILADFGEARTVFDFDRPHTKRLLPETERIVSTDDLCAIEAALLAADADRQRMAEDAARYAYVRRRLIGQLVKVRAGDSRSLWLDNEMLPCGAMLGVPEDLVDAAIDAARSSSPTTAAE